MSRNAVAFGAVILVGGLLWLVMAWQTPAEEDAQLAAAPAEPPSAASQPSAAPAAEPGPAPAEPAPAADEGEEPAPSEPGESAEQAEPAVEEEPAPPRVLAEQITGDQGPVEEYRQQYSLETRASDSAEVEAKLRAAFLDKKSAGDLIKSVSCRKEICKIEMRWSMARYRDYVTGLTRIGPGFVKRYALSPVSEPDAAGVRLVEVYMKRKFTVDPVLPLHAH